MEVHHLQPEAAVRRLMTEVHHTTEDLHTTGVHHTAAVRHLTTVGAVHLPAAVTAEAVRILPEAHRTAAEVHTHPAEDTEDNRTT